MLVSGESYSCVNHSQPPALVPGSFLNEHSSGGAAARVQWEVHMVRLTVSSLQDTGKFLCHWPRACLSVPSSYFLLRGAPTSIPSSQVCSQQLEKKTKPKSLRLVFNWRHEYAFQPLKWEGKWKLNRILFSRHPVIPHDDFDTNLSKMNLNWNASAHADFFHCW